MLPPAIWPVMTTASRRDRATCRPCTGTASPTMAIVSGITPPAANPASARTTSSESRFGTKAEAISMIVRTDSATVMTRRLPMASPTGPRIGWISANGRA